MLPGCHAFKECVKTFQKQQAIETLTVSEIIGRCPNLIIDVPTVDLTGNLQVCNGNLIIQSITSCDPEFPIEITGNVVFHNNVSIEGTLFVCDIVQGPNCNIDINFCNAPLELNEVAACPGESSVDFLTNVVIQGNLQVCDIVATNCPGQNINIGPNVTVGDTLFVCTINSLGCPGNEVTIGPNVEITDTLTVCNINALGCPGNQVIIGPNVNITDTLTVCNINALGCPNNTVTIGPNVNIPGTLDICNISCASGNVSVCDAFLNFNFFLPCPGVGNVDLFSVDSAGRGLRICNPNQFYTDFVNSCSIFNSQVERIVQFNNAIEVGQEITTIQPFGTVDLVNFNLGYGAEYHTEMVVSMSQLVKEDTQIIPQGVWTTVSFPFNITSGFVFPVDINGNNAWTYPVMYFSTSQTTPIPGTQLANIVAAGFTNGYLINSPHRSGFNFQRWTNIVANILWSVTGAVSSIGTTRAARYRIFNGGNGLPVSAPFGPTYSVLYDALEEGRLQAFDHIDNRLGTTQTFPISINEGRMALQLEVWHNDPTTSPPAVNPVSVNSGGSDQTVFQINFYA